MVVVKALALETTKKGTGFVSYVRTFRMYPYYFFFHQAILDNHVTYPAAPPIIEWSNMRIQTSFICIKLNVWGVGFVLEAGFKCIAIAIV